MKVALLLSLLSNVLEYEPLIVSVTTLPKKTTTWKFVSMLSNKESKSFSQKINLEITGSPAVTRKLVTSGSRNIPKQSRRRKPSKLRIGCYICSKIGRLSSNCKTSKGKRNDWCSFDQNIKGPKNYESN